MTLTLTEARQLEAAARDLYDITPEQAAAGQKSWLETRKKPGYVYFVQEEDGGPFKIGWAADPKRRLAGMQTGNPRKLCIRAMVSGRRSLERTMHDRFAGHRLAGEWFTSCEEIATYIEEHGIIPESET